MFSFSLSFSVRLKNPFIVSDRRSQTNHVNAHPIFAYSKISRALFPISELQKTAVCTDCAQLSKRSDVLWPLVKRTKNAHLSGVHVNSTKALKIKLDSQDAQKNHIFLPIHPFVLFRVPPSRQYSRISLISIELRCNWNCDNMVIISTSFPQCIRIFFIVNGTRMSLIWLVFRYCPSGLKEIKFNAMFCYGLKRVWWHDSSFQSSILRFYELTHFVLVEEMVMHGPASEMNTINELTIECSGQNLRK